MFLVNISLINTTERQKIHKLFFRQTADKQHREAPAILTHHLGVPCFTVTFVKNRGEREPWVDLFVMIKQCKFHPTWIVGIDMSLLRKAKVRKNAVTSERILSFILQR